MPGFRALTIARIGIEPSKGDLQRAQMIFRPTGTIENKGGMRGVTADDFFSEITGNYRIYVVFGRLG